MADKVISDISQEERDAHNEAIDDIDNLRTAVAAARTLANELKADYALLLADVTALNARVAEARTLANELKADHNAALTKLDNDATVTDTNYNALHATAAADVAAVAAVTATAIAAADVGALPSKVSADLLGG